MIWRGSSRLCCVVPGCAWWWFSEPSLGGFLSVFSGPCSWGFHWGNSCEPFVVFLPLIPLPNMWVKGLDFGVFGVLGLEEFLAGFLWILLIWQVLVDKILAMDSPWGVPTIPKLLHKSVEWFGTSEFGFGPLLGFARVNVWVSSLLSRVAAVSRLGLFGAWEASLVFWGFLA
jgi:hypothetical protein